MDYTLQLEPGQTKPVNCGEANFFCVKLAGVPLLIARPGEEFAQYEQGDRFTVQDGKSFLRLEVKNPTLATATVVIFAGNNRYEQQRQSTLEAATEIVGSPVTNIANLASIVFPGTPAGAQIRRRSILFSNLDPNSRLKLKDGAGNFCSAIEKESSQVLFLSGPVTLYNDSGGNITFFASEVFYVAT